MHLVDAHAAHAAAHAAAAAAAAAAGGVGRGEEKINKFLEPSSLLALPPF